MCTQKGAPGGEWLCSSENTLWTLELCLVRWFGPIYSFILHAVSTVCPQGRQNKGVLNVSLISELTENNTEILGTSTHTQHLELPRRPESQMQWRRPTMDIQRCVNWQLVTSIWVPWDSKELHSSEASLLHKRGNPNIFPSSSGNFLTCFSNSLRNYSMTGRWGISFHIYQQ